MTFVKIGRVSINLRQIAVLLDLDDTGKGQAMLYQAGYDKPIFLDAEPANTLRKNLGTVNLDPK